jgi:hypothetical protein
MDMVGWIAIGVLYVLSIGGFRWLGGIGAAGEALRQWGRSRADARTRPVSS